MNKNQQVMRILAALFAFVFAVAMMAGAIREAIAEGETGTDSASFLTLEEYEAGVQRAAEAISQYLQDDGLTAKIQSAYFLVNYAYINEELYLQLVEKGYIAENDIYDDYGTRTRDNPDGWINIDNFRALRDAMLDYNERHFSEDYVFGTKDINHYIDPSVLCADGHDREIVHLLFEKWVGGYDMHKSSPVQDNKLFGEAHRLLISLTAVEESQRTDVSIGARWLMAQTTGRNLMNFLENYLLNNYTFAELEPYFDPEEMKHGAFYLKDDIEINPDNMSALEYIVYCYGQEWDICIINADTEIFAALKALEPIEEEDWEFEEEEEEEEE